jgi:hypothetical protein
VVRVRSAPPSRPRSFNEFARPDALLKVFADFPEGGLAHRAPERIADQLAFIHDRLTLDIAVACISDGATGKRLSLLADVMLPRPPSLGLLHHMLCLVPERFRYLAVSFEHFFRRQRALALPRAMSRDLGGPRPR